MTTVAGIVRNPAQSHRRPLADAQTQIGCPPRCSVAAPPAVGNPRAGSGALAFDRTVERSSVAASAAYSVAVTISEATAVRPIHSVRSLRFSQADLKIRDNWQFALANIRLAVRINLYLFSPQQRFFFTARL